MWTTFNCCRAAAGSRTGCRRLGHISRSLKALAKELDIAIIAVAQLNREYAKRQNQKPTSADLEGSSQWEKDASTVVFIYRDNDPMVAEKDVNAANIIVDRSRNGSSGEFVVGWHGKTTQFTDEPMPLELSDAAAYRKELALKCQALPLTWDSWLLHESGYDEVLKQARQAYAGMKDGVREAQSSPCSSPGRTVMSTGRRSRGCSRSGTATCCWRPSHRSAPARSCWKMSGTGSCRRCSTRTSPSSTALPAGARRRWPALSSRW